jgi:death-on-curing protein
VTVRYLDLVDYLSIAEAVTGLDVTTLSRVADLTLADSALHAPAAGFGDEDHYPDFIDKAAVLITRLAKNHALPDGNKRTAWVALRLFIELNDWMWRDYPSVDEAEAAVLAITAGTWKEVEAAEWLRAHIAPRPG